MDKVKQCFSFKVVTHLSSHLLIPLLLTAVYLMLACFLLFFLILYIKSAECIRIVSQMPWNMKKFMQHYGFTVLVLTTPGLRNASPFTEGDRKTRWTQSILEKVYAALFSDRNSLIFGTSNVMFFLLPFLQDWLKASFWESLPSIKVALGGLEVGVM